MVIMTAQEFTQLIKQFSPDNEEQRKSFEQITYRYPYFQTAYAHYLKTLKAQEQYNYNLILRKTAILSPSRAYLHQWIEEDVSGVKKQDAPKIEAVEEQEAAIKSVETLKTASLKEKERPTLKAIKKENVNETKQTTPEKTKPKKSKPKKAVIEKHHDFDEWVALANRNKVPEQKTNVGWDEKLDLIDAFLEKKPKMPAVSADQPKVDLSKEMKFDKEELMTETLAKVYVKQKKYQKALLAYKILSLKYPEKNSFFADQIKQIKQLQQNS